MTNLEKFLNKSVEVKTVMEPASGSFRCQNLDCNEIVYEGYVDRSHNKLKWTCSKGHDSAVSI
jgi:hypothetical protein